MATAGDQINAALRLIGMLAEGETPSPATSIDALAAMNQMLDSWSTERLMIYATQDQVFTWPSGQINRTLGPTGNFIGNRPFSLDDSSYFRDASNNVAYGFKFINQAQYDGVAVKTVQATYPQVMFVNYDMPNITMFVYPVPTRDLEFHFISATELTQVASLATVLAFPPGYLRAFKYNLAIELANEFGVEPPPTVQRIAVVSKRNIKRINQDDGLMGMPATLVSGNNRYNIYSGNY